MRKHKFFARALYAVMALALVAGLTLVPVVPASALTQPTVAVDPVTLDTAAEYTIGFDVITGLAVNVGSITVKFPVDTDVPTSYADGDITVQAAGGAVTNVPGAYVSVTGQEVTITTPVGISGGDSVEVIFKEIADITNPTTGGDYTLQVKTSHESYVTSATYTIEHLPVVDSVSPVKGNDGDTMWVEVTGSGFVEAGTTFYFGSGVEVVSGSYHFVSAGEIDCQITITAAGDSRDVVPTTWGEGTTSATFDPNALNTAQVDVWEAYDLTADPFVTGTLVFQETKTTIQGAEDVSGTGDTLIVHAGTYEESVVIDQSITLLSLSDAETTIIDADDNDNAVRIGTAVDVTFQGFTVQGWTVNGVSQVPFATGIAKILDNIVIGPEETSVSGNSIQVFGGHSVVKGNEVDGTINTNPLYEGAGIIVVNGSNVVIENNWVYSADTAIAVFGHSGADVDGTQILSNTVEDSVRGIRVDAISAVKNTTIKYNVVDGNEIGIESCKEKDVTPTGTVANYNTIVNNDIGAQSVLGVSGTGGVEEVDARYNWWGDVTGPSHDTLNPGGQGNAVSDDVDFSPWLYKTQENFVEGAPCYAGSVPIVNEASLVDTSSYAGGWNSFSSPITLDGSANSISELLTLTEESDLSIIRAQRFDLTSQEWVLLADDYQIKPGEGFFIQVSTGGEGSLPILCKTTPTSPPMRNLVAGQNLIGLSSLGAETVETALSGVDYSVVVSPSPPNAAAWSVPPTSEGSVSMELGEAYWVAMGAPGILFGFTTTPVADDMTWELNGGTVA